VSGILLINTNSASPTGEQLVLERLFLRKSHTTFDIEWVLNVSALYRSIVIDYLQKSLESKDAAIMCIYCNYKEQTEQTVYEIIASLLKQLVQDRPMTSDNVKSLYEQHVGRGTRPTYDELKKAFQSEVGTSNVYVVVDALDECLERDQGYLITELRSLGGAIHLMVTSRPLLSIEQLFHHATRLDILANDTDVRKYIKDRIAHEYRLVLHVNTDRALREIIIEKIATNVKGMYVSFPIL
jgi:hypothetical protein